MLILIQCDICVDMDVDVDVDVHVNINIGNIDYRFVCVGVCGYGCRCRHIFVY